MKTISLARWTTGLTAVLAAAIGFAQTTLPTTVSNAPLGAPATPPAASQPVIDLPFAPPPPPPEEPPQTQPVQPAPPVTPPPVTQGPPPLPDKPAKVPPGLDAKARAMVSAYEARTKSKAVAGVSAMDLVTGKNLVDVRAYDLRTPASNQKILTSAFALARLGGSAVLTTRVYRLGADVVVLGDHDPTLGDPVMAEASKSNIYVELDRWAAAIRQDFGAAPVGDLIVLTRQPRTAYRHPDWPKDQFDRWYAAPVEAADFHNNCFDVVFAPVEGKLRPIVTPLSRFIRVVDQTKISKKQLWSLRISPDDATVTVTGTVARASSDPYSVAINDPPMLLGRVLADRLARAGVALGGAIRTAPAADFIPQQGRLLAETRTPLAVAITRANKNSLNMAAECVLLKAGDSTWAGSARMLSECLVRDYGLDARSFAVRDGSGLSRGDRITPAAMTFLLSQLCRRQDGQVFLRSLPVSGVDGTLRNRLGDPGSRGRILGKTGSLAGVSCLSGYTLNSQGRPAVAFSILVEDSDYNARRLQDDLVRLLVVP